MKKIKKLYSFDFDGTLFFSPTPEDGKPLFKLKTGKDWPHIGWWSKSETLDPKIFYVAKNEWMYRKYLEASSEDDSASILATGRLNKVANMRENIYDILNNNNITFDELMTIPKTEKYPINGENGVYLNWGSDTLIFKKRLFEKLIKLTKCELFTMYDDRKNHLIEFKEWAKKQKCNITIVDSISKKEETFKNK